MRNLCFYPASWIVLVLCGCTSMQQTPSRYASNLIHRQQIVAMTNDTYAPKSPQHIKLYSENKIPKKAYRIIGVAKISKYNLMGKKRQDATLHSMMKELAASVGGDALINLDTSGRDIVQANIIQFRHILL